MLSDLVQSGKIPSIRVQSVRIRGDLFQAKTWKLILSRPLGPSATIGAYPCDRQRIEPCEAVLGKPPGLCTPDGGPRIVLPRIAAAAIGPIGQSVGEGR